MADGTIRIDTKIDESGLDSSLNKMSGSLSSFAGLATSLFAGISVASFGKAALKSTADIELAQSKMETLLGSAEKSQYLISQIVKMADTTPYDSNTLIQAATTLKGFGVAAQDIMPTLTALGNASGGVADNMASVARVFGQAKAQGKLVANDFSQFINAGVPIIEVLAQGLGKSVSEIQSLRESGGITFDMLNKAFAKMYTGTGKWAGLMEKAAKTLPGMWSTLQDSSMAFGRSIVGVLEPALKNLMDVVTKLFTAGVKWVENNQELVEVIGKMAFVIFLAATAISIVTAAQWAWTTAQKALNTAMVENPIGAIIAGLIVFTGLVVVATQKFDQWGAAVLAILGPIGMLVEQIKVLYDHWKTIEKSFSSKGILQGILEIGKALVDSMILPIQQLLSYLTWIPKFGPQAKAAAAGLQKFRETYLSAKKVVDEPVKAKKPLSLVEATGIDAARLTKEQQDYTDKQKALYDELRMHLITSGMTGRQKELTLLAAEYQKKLDMAQRNAEEILMIQKWYELEKENIEKANAMEGGAGGQALQYFFGVDPKQLKSSLDFFKKGLFATGAGWTLKDFGFKKAGDFILGFSKGLDAGTFVVTSVLKGLAKMCWIAFDTVWTILSKGFDVLSWMSDFSPSEIFESFKKFINGLSDFFTNDIGSLPLSFNAGVKVFEDFINGMIQHLPATIETIGNVIDLIVTYFIENGPRLIEQIFTIIFALFDKLTDKIPQIIDAVMTIVNAIIEKLPMIVDKLLNALVVALEAFGDNAEKFASTLVGAIAGILDSIANNIGPLLIAVVKIVVALINGIIQKIPTLMASFDKLMLALVQALTDAFPVLLKGIIAAIPALITAIVESVTNSLDEHTGEKMIIAVVVGITKSIPGVVKALVLAIGKIFTESIPALFKGLYNVGKNVVLGIKKGFTDYAPRLWEAMKSFFTSLVDKVKSFFGIHSPSTLFYGFGVNIIQGLINGIKSLGSSIFNIFIGFFTDVFGYFSSIVGKFAEAGASFASALIDGIKTIVTKFSELIAPFADIVNKFFSPINAAISLLQSAFDNIITAIQTVVDAFKALSFNPFAELQNGINAIIGAFYQVYDIVKLVIDKIKELSGLGGGGGGLGDLLGGVGGKAGKFFKKHFKHFASGTNYAPGGVALVGEQGPELVNLPRGSRVFTAAETKAMLSGKGYQSLVNGLSGGLSMSPALASSGVTGGGMTIRNIMTGTVQVDGRTLARIVYENLDKVHKAAYGN